MDELYVRVRGVSVPKIQIDQIEQQFGAKLVHDGEWDLIHSLDQTLKRYRAENNKDPDAVALLDRPGELFKHMTLNVNFLNMEVPGPYNKPAWFRMKRHFKLNNIH